MSNWIEEIKRDPNKGISKVYKNYKSSATGWIMNRYSLSEVDALDVFQNSVAIFYQNIELNKVKYGTATLKTYLFAICRNQALKIKKHSSYSNICIDNISEPMSEEVFTEENDEQIEKCFKALSKLSEQCQELLRSFYLQRKKIPELTRVFQYTSDNSTKTQKYKCLKNLKKIWFENNNS